MRDILAPSERAVLERFARSRAMLAFDLDGTLAPIVADPRRVAVPPETRAALREAAAVYPVVVITGRARRDARARLRGTGVRDVIGNHGMEPWSGAHRVVAAVRRWRASLDEALAAIPGIDIEDKRYSLSVHYRRARDRRRARAAVLRAVAGLDGARIIGGKQVANVVPLGAPHKGDALERERARLRCETMIFVGDDETDEDVFRLESRRLLAIRVRTRRGSAARHFLRTRADIDELLRRLVALRHAPGRPAGR
jgi:trehalose 6-phosphate phosphatase